MAFKRIVVTGSRGLLGRELVPFLRAKGYDVYGTTSDSLNLLATGPEILEKLSVYEPEIIIHAAAYTNVDGAEREPELAMAINQDGTRKVAEAARALGAVMACISTDYVFDGTAGRPYQVSDATRPLGVYGQSKLYGEWMMQEMLDTSYVIRTSWLYGLYGKNFVQFVISAAREGRDIRVVDDQIGSPTWTGTLCHLSEQIVTSGAYGVYHVADRGAVSRYQQALAICRAAGLSAENIQPVPGSQFPQAARRPAYSPLDPSPLDTPHWETALQAFIEQYQHGQTLV
jgi:dTDP-4-dehydrorhamnose reductase